MIFTKKNIKIRKKWPYFWSLNFRFLKKWKKLNPLKTYVCSSKTPSINPPQIHDFETYMPYSGLKSTKKTLFFHVTRFLWLPLEVENASLRKCPNHDFTDCKFALTSQNLQKHQKTCCCLKKPYRPPVLRNWLHYLGVLLTVTHEVTKELLIAPLISNSRFWL